MKRYAEFVIRFRIAIIVLTLGITGWLGYEISTLTVNSDILSYLPQDKETVKVFNQVGKVFGGNSMGVIAFEASDGNVFSAKALKTIRGLTHEYEKIDGVRSVISITNVLDIKKIEGGLEIGKLVPKDRIPETKEELEALRKYTLSKDMYSGRLVSTDGKYSAMMVRLNEGVDRSAVGSEIRDTTEKSKGDLVPYYAGLPLWMVFINEIIFGDMGLLIPLVAFLVMLILFLSFRTFRGVLLPLGTVLFSTTWALGLMAVFDVELTLISNGLPVLLIAIGSAYGIHMLNKYNELVGGGESPAEGLKLAIAQVGLPIILAGVTTLAGFLSFTTSYLTLIQEFGVFVAIGVFCALLLSTSFLPAVLSLMKPRGTWRARYTGEKTGGVRLMSMLASLVIGRPKMILAGTVVIALVASLGLLNIKRSVNMVEYFKKDSHIRVAEELLENEFGGAMAIQIRVRGPIKDPFVLKEMLRIEKFLKTLPDVSHPQSVADLVCEMNLQMNGRYAIPDSIEKVGNLWMLIDGNSVMEQLVTPDEREAVIQAMVGTADSGKLMKLVNSVNEFVQYKVHREWAVKTMGHEQGAKENGGIAARQAPLDRVVELVNFDVAARWSDDSSSLSFLRAAISKPANHKVDLGDKAHLPGSIELLMEYLSGDDGEIEIASDEVLGRLKSGMEEVLAKGDGLSEYAFFPLLRRELDAETLEEDPNAVKELALSLWGLMRERRGALRVAAILGDIKASLPPALRSDPWLMRDLSGDLWALNDTHVAVVDDPTSSQASKTKVYLVVTGMPPIYKELDESLVASQYRSLIMAVLIVLLLVALQFRSWVAGLVAIVPIVFTVLLNFGLMGYLGIPLDITTVMIASVAVGIGVDYAIHFLSRVRLERIKGGEIEGSIRTTLETTGIAISTNAVSVSMGFIALLFGSLVPMQNFGWMTALTMVVSALSAMILIPAILILLKRVKFLNPAGGKAQA
ncbi:MAG: RND family transporter [Deltaproteobacteria bacterium]|nr:RND family transporter [Deltaproteobacteria bacterium]